MYQKTIQLVPMEMEALPLETPTDALRGLERRCTVIRWRFQGQTSRIIVPHHAATRTTRLLVCTFLRSAD